MAVTDRRRPIDYQQSPLFVVESPIVRGSGGARPSDEATTTTLAGTFARVINKRTGSACLDETAEIALGNYGESICDIPVTISVSAHCMCFCVSCPLVSVLLCLGCVIE